MMVERAMRAAPTGVEKRLNLSENVRLAHDEQQFAFDAAQLLVDVAAKMIRSKALCARSDDWTKQPHPVQVESTNVCLSKQLKI